jgi:hypothetical protein
MPTSTTLSTATQSQQFTLSTALNDYTLIQNELNNVISSLQSYCALSNEAVQGLNDLSSIPVVGTMLSGSVAQLDQYILLSQALATGVSESLSVIDSLTSISAIETDLADALDAGYNSVFGLTGSNTVAPFSVVINDTAGVQISYQSPTLFGTTWNASVSGNLGMGNLMSGVSGSASLSLGALLGGSLTAGYNDTGFYVDTLGTALGLDVGASLSGSLGMNLGFLSVTATAPNNGSTSAYANFLLQPTGGTSSGNYIYFNNGSINFSTQVKSNYNLDLSLNAATTASGYLPQIGAELYVSSSTLNGGGGFSNPTVQFRNAQLNVGTYLQGFLGPILGDINQGLSYITPITNILTTPIPLLSSIGAPNTLLDLATLVSGYSGNKDAIAATNLVSNIVNFVNVANEVTSIASGSGEFNLGSFTLSGPSSPTSSAYLPSLPSTISVFSTASNYISKAVATAQAPTNSGTTASNVSSLTQVLQNTTNGGWAIPLLEGGTASYTAALDLLTGANTPFTLLDYSFPGGQLSANTQETYNIFGPLAINFGGGVTLSAGLEIGYDSTGIMQYIASGESDPLLLLDGLYVSGLDLNGNSSNTVASISGSLNVGGSISIVVASASAGGVITATANIGVVDNGSSNTYAGVTGNPSQYYLFTPTYNAFTSGSLPFSISGDVTAGAYANVTIGWPPFGYTWSWNSPTVTLFSFADIPTPPTPPPMGTFVGGNYALIDTIFGNYTPNIQVFPSGTISGGYQFGVLYSNAGSSGNTNYSTIASISNGNYIIATLGAAGGAFTANPSSSFPMSVTSGSAYTQISTGTGDDTIVVGDGSDNINGGAGNNSIVAGNGDNYIIGSNNGTDTIYLGNGDNTFSGSSGGNLIYAGSGSNLFNLMAGAQTIIASPSSQNQDTVSFQNDSLGGGIYVNLDPSYAGGATGDSLSGINCLIGSYTENNTLIGGSQPVILQGGIGYINGVSLSPCTLVGNTLIGNSGSDTFIPGTGANSIIGDTILGTPSSNLVDFGYLTSAVVVDLKNQIFGGGASEDTIQGIQNVIGTSYAYSGGESLSPASSLSLGGTSLEGVWSLSGSSLLGITTGSLLGATGDTVCYSSSLGSNQSVTVSGGADYLAGNDQNNILSGNGGVLGDTLVTYRGMDSIYGAFFNLSQATIQGLGQYGISNALGVIDWSSETHTSAGYGSTISLDSLGNLSGTDSLGNDAVTGTQIGFLEFAGSSGFNSINISNTLGYNTVVGGYAGDYINVANAGPNNSLSGGFTGGTFTSPSLSDITSSGQDTILANTLQTGTLTTVTPGIRTLSGGNSLVAANFSQLTTGYNWYNTGAVMAAVTTPGANQAQGLDFIGSALLGSLNDTVNFDGVRANHNIWTGGGNDTVNAGYGQIFADGGTGTNLLQINWANENTLTGSLTPGMTFLGSFATMSSSQTVNGGGLADYLNGTGTASAYFSSSSLNLDQVNFANFQQLSITGSNASDFISLSSAVSSSLGGGQATLNGGIAGNDTIIGGYYSTDSLVGGSGNVSFGGGFTGGNFASPNLNNILGASFDTVLGGAALGTLSTVTAGISTLYGGNSLVAANFSQLTIGYNLTDNGADMAPVTTPGGTRLMPISLAGGSNTLGGLDFIGSAVLGSGNDTVNFNNVRANHNVWTGAGNDTVNTGYGQVYADGGSGTNLLQINWANENTLTGSLTPGMTFLGSFATTGGGAIPSVGGTYAYQNGSGTVTAPCDSLGNSDQISFVNFQQISLIGTAASDFISLSSATTSTVNGMGTSLNGYSTLSGGPSGNDTIIGGYYSADSLVGGSGNVSFSGGFTGGTFSAPSLSNILLAANDTVLAGSALGSSGNTLTGVGTLYGGNSLVAANFSQLTIGYNLTDNGADMAPVTTPGGTRLMPISLAGGSNTLGGLDFIGNALLGSGNDTVNFNNVRANHNVWTGAGNDTVNTGYGQVYADGGSGTNLLQINWANENTLNGAMPAGMTLNGSFDTTSGGAIPSAGGTYNQQNANGSVIAYYGSLLGNKDQVNFVNFQQVSITGTSANDYLAMMAYRGWGAATLNGGSAGNDTIIGGHDSSDSLIGGSGNVFFNPGFTGTSSSGANLTDILTATNDTIVSGSALGTLAAVNGGSTIVGGTLSPTSAVYTLSGGNTLMAANFSQLTVPYTLNGNGGDLAAVTAAGGTRILPVGGSGTLSGIDFIGSAALGTPTVPGAGNTVNFANIRAPHNVWSGGGNDTLSAGFGKEYLDGQAGNNLLQINWQKENLSTGTLPSGMTFMGTFAQTNGGTMTGGGTFDIYEGQGMATAYYGSNASNIDQINFVNMQQLNITGTAGNNFMQITTPNKWSTLAPVGFGNATLCASIGGGNNTLIGGDYGAELLIGGSGNDSISGGPLDTMIGGGGTNVYGVSSTSNRITDTGVNSLIKSSVSFNLASTLVSGVNNLAYTGLSGASLIGNASANSLSASLGNDTFQGWNGSAAANATSDTLVGSSGADLFVMANRGDTNNAYGNGHSNTALLRNFSASAGDIIQLHNFGGSHAGSSGYTTVSGGAGIIDIYSYLGNTAANEVAVINVSSGSFSWTKNASFI